VVAPGEAVGELGLLTGQPHRGTVRAFRDCTLLRIPELDLVRRLVGVFPEALAALTRHVLDRFAGSEAGDGHSPPHTFALLGHDRRVAVRDVAESIAEALGAHGSTLVVPAAMGRSRDALWHAAREQGHRFLLYVADAEDAAWRATCIRQADQMLLVAEADAAPGPWPDGICRSKTDALHRVRRLLLLGHPGAPPEARAAPWLARFPEPLPLHHLRGPPDYARLARYLAHRAVGLVLSGGGARGFAHLGVVRALRELGQPIDAVGGTSMGAIIGAGVACEWDDRQILENLRRTFVHEHPLRDFTIPLVALTRGARTTRLLRACFGEREIEDLALPFFCMSANLTNGCADVHASGPLWKWLRAGAAIPGILPPLLDAGMVHVDGAIMNNLPTDVMRDRGAHEVIAVDISAAGSLRASFEGAAVPSLPQLTWQWLNGRQWPSLYAVLLCAAMAGSESASQARRTLATHLLRPPHGGIGLLNWRGHERAIENGYRHAMAYFGPRK